MLFASLYSANAETKNEAIPLSFKWAQGTAGARNIIKAKH
jgi:hypothetical protein